MSDFHSLYSHDFVRVRVLRAAHPRGRRRLQSRRDAAAGRPKATRPARPSWSFPSSGLSSYAIEDLLLQDALLDEVERVDRQGRRGLEASSSLS